MLRRALVVLLLLMTVPRPVAALELQVADRTLPNGMRVLVHEDHSAPVVSSYVYYRVGSRNERPGQTGMAHLFEHMMFNGGRKYGPGMFDDLIEGNGGSTNGFTTRDVTVYLNNMPREALPLVLDLESDRMEHLAITAKNLEQERGIVMEERRLRLDDSVGGVMDEQLHLLAYTIHPYRWSVLGFMADLERITLDQARAFFRTYYAPNNAILVLAGDVETTEVFGLAQRYFGGFPRRPPPAPVDVVEPPQEAERRAIIRRNAELPALLIGYHGISVGNPDRAVLDVIERLLAGGDSTRLVEDLVREKEVATDVAASNDWGIDPELFWIYAQARPGKTAADLEARIDAVVARLASKVVSEDELRKAKNQLRSGLLRGLKTVSGKANQLGYFEAVLGDHRAFLGLEAGWEGVTAADVQRAAATYLVRTRRTVVTLQPVPLGRPLREGGLGGEVS